MKSTQTSENGHRNLNRMDFLRLLILGGGAAFLSACKQEFAETLATQPSDGKRATPEGGVPPTDALEPSATPGSTEEPNPTATQEQPTETSSPTETPTPTETLTPEIIFMDDFSGELIVSPGNPNAWNNIHKQGAAVQIIDDPTNSKDSSGSPRGKVLKCSVSGSSKLEGGGEWMRRGYPGWVNEGGYFNSKTVEAPAAGQVDVYISKELFYSESNGKPSLSILSFHCNRKNRAPNEEPGFAIGLSIAGGGRYLGIMDNKGNWITLSKVTFPKNQWVTVRLEVDSQGRVFPFINNKLAYPDGIVPFQIPSEMEIGFGDFHAGLYTSSGTNSTPDFPEGAFLLNDNFEIIKYLATIQFDDSSVNTKVNGTRD